MKKITNVSTHLINQFNSMLIDNINEIKLCDNNVSYESHKSYLIYSKILKI